MIIRESRLLVAATLALTTLACSGQPAESKPGAPVGAATTPVPPAASTTAATAEAAPSTPSGLRVAEQTATPASAPLAAPPAPATTAPVATPAADPVPAPPAEPVYREITIPAGTPLALDLRTTVASETSRIEDRVSAALREPVIIRGAEALPAGTLLTGHVTDAARSARVKGRARVAFRFTSLDLPGDLGTTAIRTSPVVRQAAETKKADAAKIGGGAAGGAILGAIFGGGSGAAKGAAIGGGAGTGVVLSTRGKEVTVAAGTNLTVNLQVPITVRVRR